MPELCASMEKSQNAPIAPPSGNNSGNYLASQPLNQNQTVASNVSDGSDQSYSKQPQAVSSTAPQPIMTQPTANQQTVQQGQPVAPVKKKARLAGSVIFAILVVIIILVALGVPQQLLDDGSDSGGNDLFGKSYTAGSGNWIKSWKFEGDNYTIKFSLTSSDYEYYLNYQIVHQYRYLNDHAHGLDFITTNSSVIIDIAASINYLKAQAGLSDVQTANLALSFVQTCFPYVYDNVTYGVEDYWAFPLETLHNGQGDCEDKSFLYASIMVDLGYDTALLFFDDHVAVGIGAYSVPSGTYYDVGGVNYYYCETTSSGWTMGEIPQDYGESYVIVV